MLYYSGGGQFGFQTVGLLFQEPKCLKSKLSEFQIPLRSDFGLVWISAVWTVIYECMLIDGTSCKAMILETSLYFPLLLTKGAF